MIAIILPLDVTQVQPAQLKSSFIITHKPMIEVVAFNEVKDKAVPLQSWSGPEVSRKLRFPDFMTTAQDGGKVVSLTRRPLLPPGNVPGTHFC